MTPEYAAPEQLTRRGHHDRHRCLCLGRPALCVADRATSRRRAARTRSADLVKAIVDVEPTRPSDIVAHQRRDAEVADRNAAQRGTTPDKLQPAAARRPRHDCGQGAEERTRGALFLGHGSGRRSAPLPEKRADQRPAGHARVSGGQVRAPQPRGSGPGDTGNCGHGCWRRGNVGAGAKGASATRLRAAPTGPRASDQRVQ